MGRIASAIIVLAGAHLLAVSVLVGRISATPSGQVDWMSMFGCFLMVAGFIAMLPGGWRNQRIVEITEQPPHR